MYIYIYVYTYVYTYVSLYRNIYVCIERDVYTYIYIYIYIYIYTHSHDHGVGDRVQLAGDGYHAAQANSPYSSYVIDYKIT